MTINNISINNVMEYRHEPLVERFALAHKVPNSVAEHRFAALKQFLIVCALKPGYKIPSAQIDEMWHSFLLFSKDYENFCLNSFSQMIYHNPLLKAGSESYFETRAFAEKIFGELDENEWSLESKADCIGGCSD